MLVSLIYQFSVAAFHSGLTVAFAVVSLCFCHGNLSDFVRFCGALTFEAIKYISRAGGPPLQQQHTDIIPIKGSQINRG